jgi:anti-sigma regulatory factor (Ser/Thr protein kinase)
MRERRELARYTDTVELIRHELSTPVATALLYIGIAESYALRLPVDVITPALRVVRSEVQRLKALIETMTELQRSGTPTLKPRFIDVGGTVKAAVKRLLTTFSGTEGVSISLPPQGLHGWWDPTAVEQIVTNLLTNALKFGQGRSVRLAVRSANAGVTISVRDQGIGITAADQLRIFKRHEHAPAAQGGGMGLGLWLVRELAEAHGGRVVVRSRKGRGTTFTVLLRAQPPHLGSGSPDRESAVARLPPQRSPMRSVSGRSPQRTLFPPYWQDRLVKSQMKAALLPRKEIDVAPISTIRSPSLTADLKAKWPSRPLKAITPSAVRSSVASRALGRSRNFTSPTLRGSGL